MSDEQARPAGLRVLQPDQDADLSAVASVGAGLDLFSGALSDLHPQLLGLRWPDANRSHRDSDGNPILPAPVAAPVLLPGGGGLVHPAGVVDAFGRFVDLTPPSAVTTSASLQPLPRGP